MGRRLFSLERLEELLADVGSFDEADEFPLLGARHEVLHTVLGSAQFLGENDFADQGVNEAQFEGVCFELLGGEQGGQVLEE